MEDTREGAITEGVAAAIGAAEAVGKGGEEVVVAAGETCGWGERSLGYLILGDRGGIWGDMITLIRLARRRGRGRRRGACRSLYPPV